MVKQIVRDVFFLGQPSEPATKADIQVGRDLQDTLQANRERCVGMAANMIGVKKNIIIVNMGFIGWKRRETLSAYADGDYVFDISGNGDSPGPAGYGIHYQ